MKYYINNSMTSNPGFHHEVHSEKCFWVDLIKNKTYLGEFSNGVEAVKEGKKYYYDADGCKHCCPEAHKG